MTALQGKTALVTGASAGIGLATVRLLSHAGARVICCARRLERLQTQLDELPGPGLAVVLDVADAVSAASLPDRLPQDWTDAACDALREPILAGAFTKRLTS